MLEDDIVIFTIHQFVIMTFCLFLVYFAWRDIFSEKFDKFNYVPLKIIGPLLIGLFIGIFLMLLNEWGSIGIILSFAFALLITLSIYDPKYAVSFFVYLMISRPWEFFKNPMMDGMPRDIFILCFLSFIGHRIIRKRYFFQWNMASACTLSFAIWVFFSIIPSGNMAGALVDYNEKFSKGIIIYFLIVNVVDKEEFISPIQTALFLGITEKAFMSFYNSFVLGNTSDGGRLQAIGMLENSNDIAAIMLLAVPFAMAAFNGITNKILRSIVCLIVFTFYAYLIWLSKSRGAVLGLGAFILGWYWLKAANKKIAGFVIIAGLIASMGAMSLIKRDAGDVEGSTNNRKIYWIAALNMGIRHPILGVGYDGFPKNLGTYTNGHIGSEGVMTAHSTWLLALGETGFVGLLFYAGIWVSAGRSAWTMRFAHPEFFLALLSYGTAITFLSHTYMTYPYILLGIVVASGQFYVKEEETVTIGLEGALTEKGLA
jgi:hypothetical protein